MLEPYWSKTNACLVRLFVSKQNNLHFQDDIILAVSREVKENGNPIYEGPLYENMEESPPSLPPPPSTRRRVSGGFIRRSVDNVYHSSPVPIPTGSETEGLYAELTDRKQDSQPTAPEEGEEETYTIMSPVGPAARDGLSFTPYMEDRAAWIGNRK